MIEREIEGQEHMPDLLDRAAYIAANLNIDALARVRREAEKLEMRLGKPDGSCMHCSAPVPELARFCDDECAAGWQREDDARRRHFGES